MKDVLRTSEGFGQNVSGHLCHWTIYESDPAEFDFLIWRLLRSKYFAHL